ncbi:MAG: SWIM zinc finger family protein [Acidobacteriota bacterium]
MFNDRISRAWEIIKINDAWYVKHLDKFIVNSQSDATKTYEVYGLYCECPDALHGNICKHILATTGKLVTLACISFREASTESQLYQLANDFAPKFADVPNALVSIARNEFKRQREIFRLAENAQRIASEVAA